MRAVTLWGSGAALSIVRSAIAVVANEKLTGGSTVDGDLLTNDEPAEDDLQRERICRHHGDPWR